MAAFEIPVTQRLPIFNKAFFNSINSDVVLANDVVAL